MRSVARFNRSQFTSGARVMKLIQFDLILRSIGFDFVN